MWWYDPDAANRQECKYVREFQHLATETILAHLAEPTTTPEQYQLGLECLQALKDQLMGRVDAFHRSPFYGRHWCIENAYGSFRQKLLNAIVLRPVPQPESAPEPPPEKPRRSLREVLEEYENEDETYLGDIVQGDEQ